LITQQEIAIGERDFLFIALTNEQRKEEEEKNS